MRTFPVAVARKDAMSVYCALLDEGLPADELILAGDSGGGGLVTSVIQAATEVRLIDEPGMFHVYMILTPWTSASRRLYDVIAEVFDEPRAEKRAEETAEQPADRAQ